MNEEIKTLENIIIKTTIYIKKYLLNNIITNNIYNKSIEKLENIYSSINNKKINNINDIENTKNNISKIIQSCGTENLKDLIYITSFKIKNNKKYDSKLELLFKYFHPFNYKIFNTKNNKKETISKLTIVDNDKILKFSKNYECYNLGRTSINYFIQVYGI